MADSSVADVDANAMLDEANSTSEAQGEPKFTLEEGLKKTIPYFRRLVEEEGAVARPFAEQGFDRT